MIMNNLRLTIVTKRRSMGVRKRATQGQGSHETENHDRAEQSHPPY